MQDPARVEPVSAEPGPIPGLLIPRDEIAALARLLDAAAISLGPDQAAIETVLSRAHTLVTSMLRSDTGHGEAGAEGGGMAPWQVRRVRAYVEERLHEALTVKQVAEAVRLSCSHFSRAFKASFGVSPHAYIMRRRIERAKRLMRTSNEPLVQIALTCGLSDQAHLSRAFRRAEGCSPSTWRRYAR